MGNTKVGPKDWLQFVLLIGTYVGGVILLHRFFGTAVALILGIPVGLVLAPIAFIFLVVALPEGNSSSSQNEREQGKAGR